jgi:hypothetical protein
MPEHIAQAAREDWQEVCDVVRAYSRRALGALTRAMMGRIPTRSEAVDLVDALDTLCIHWERQVERVAA